MNRTTATVVMSAFAAGIIPTLTLVAPLAAHAETENELSQSEQHYLDEQRATIINASEQLHQDENTLALTEQAHKTLRTLADEAGDGYWLNGHYYSDALEPELRTADQAVSQELVNEREQVKDDQEQLQYDANQYRGHLHNDDLMVPDQLPFITDNV